jgi:protein arginine kinase activator
MLCEKCQAQQASVFLTEMVAGKMQKIDLCEHCAKELGITHHTGFSLEQLLMKSSLLSAESRNPQPDQAQCPACGCTLAEVRKQGRLGCPECYTTFQGFLAEAIQTMQKAPRHVGKIPSCSRVQVDLASRRRGLEAAILDAVKAEDYEQAARLREELKGIGS